MSQEVIQTGRSAEETQTQHGQPPREVAIKSPFRRWPTVLVSGLLVAIASAGIYALVKVGLWLFLDSTARAVFITGNAVNLFIFLAIVAQACIYLGQRRVMIEQWSAMRAQLATINRQEGYLSAQADAAKAQSETMLAQLGLMQKQVETAGRQIDLMVLNECAYVRIGTVDIEWDGQSIGVEGTFENGGRTPALNFRYNMLVSLVDIPEVAEYQPDIHIDEAQPPSIIVANTAPKSFSADPVGLSNEQITKIKRKDVEVMFDGLCRYDDILGGRVYYRFGLRVTLSYPPKTTERYQNYYREQANPN